MTDALFISTLLDEATHPFKAAGKFAYHFSRGKLSSDCIFRELLRRGVFPKQGGRFLDLGCGQSVFASWLFSARALFEKGQWPTAWPEPPKILEYRGFELMESDVSRANEALGDRRPAITVAQGDICKTDFGTADVVTILDVLHYIDYAGQEDVLARVRKALPAGGLLVTRVGDAGAGLPYHICNWVDRMVTFVRGHRLPTLYCRHLEEWIALLEKLGFQVETMSMSEGKPFANIMLIARLPV